MSLVNLNGKTIVITGANRGIGLGIAECCLANGAKMVWSLDVGSVGEDFMALQAKHPGQLAALVCDVTSEELLTNAFNQVLGKSGSIEGVVANAGITNHKAALDFTAEEIERLVHINLFGFFYTARVAARVFMKLGIKGSIVATASMASYRPNKRVPSAMYGATKGGIRNMVHTLAMEWAEHEIRVNSVSPGLVQTAMTYWCTPEFMEQMKIHRGFQRLATIQELGGAYVYLLSDAASYTTSQDIQVNGVVGIC